MDPEVPVTEDEGAQGWLVVDDFVLVQAVAVAVGIEALTALIAQLVERDEYLQAAKLERLKTTFDAQPDVSKALSLVEKSGATIERYQLEVDILTGHFWRATSSEKARLGGGQVRPDPRAFRSVISESSNGYVLKQL